MPTYTKPNSPRLPAQRDPTRRGLVASWLFHEGLGSGSNSPDSATFNGPADWATKSQLSFGPSGVQLPGVHVDGTADATAGISLVSRLVGGLGMAFGCVLDYVSGGANETILHATANGTLGQETCDLIGVAGNALKFKDDYGGNMGPTAGGTFPNGTHAVMVTRTGANIDVYVDGVLLMTKVSAFGPTEVLGTMSLGTRVAQRPMLGSTFLMAAAWSRKFTATDAARWAHDPYSIWKFDNRGIAPPNTVTTFYKDVTP